MTQRATCETLAKAGVRTKSRPLRTAIFAGVLGLEPRLTGPEPVVLPITPYPTDARPSRHVDALSAGTCGSGPAGEKPYTRLGGASKTRAPVVVERPIRRASSTARA